MRHLITNPAQFQRAPAVAPTDVAAAAGDVASAAQAHEAAAAKPSPGFGGSWFGFRAAARPASNSAGSSKPPLSNSHRLVITPRHDHAACGSHGCTLCPANLCKGRELATLRAANTGRRVVYCGDGANDLCAALQLGPGDAVLARAGHQLEALLAQRAAAGVADGSKPVAAQVHVWRSHEELFRLVQQLAA